MDRILIIETGLVVLGTGTGFILAAYGKGIVRKAGTILMWGSLPCFLIWIYLGSPGGHGYLRQTAPPQPEGSGTELQQR